MVQINVTSKAMQNGDNVTSYKNTVGTAQETFTFLTAQETVILSNKGSKNINYTIGSNTGVLIPSTSVTVTGSFDSLVLSAEQGTQAFEVWADEVGTSGVSSGAIATLDGKVTDLTTSLAQNTQLKGTTQSIVFNTDGTIQKVQHKDSLNNILREDVFTYATNLITEVRTLSAGGSVTFKYHLDTLETEVI